MNRRSGPGRPGSGTGWPGTRGYCLRGLPLTSPAGLVTPLLALGVTHCRPGCARVPSVVGGRYDN
jgi:hypothetical protein